MCWNCVVTRVNFILVLFDFYSDLILLNEIKTQLKEMACDEDVDVQFYAQRALEIIEDTQPQA